MSKSTTSIEASVGPKSCLGAIITILAIVGIWAVIFGVTINGKHYGLSCSSSEGIEVDLPSKD